YKGQIDDLARMPSIVANHTNWLRIDENRVYAAGGSMGGHETLLLLGQHPKLLKGAIAIDPVTNFVRRYDDFGRNIRTKGLQALARIEVGGTPKTNIEAYVLRSPSHWVTQIAAAGVPLQPHRALLEQPTAAGLGDHAGNAGGRRRARGRPGDGRVGGNRAHDVAEAEGDREGAGALLDGRRVVDRERLERLDHVAAVQV